MAKRQKDTPTAKYALSDLRVSRVSLVDSPAVPKSVFVIAKRADDEPVEVKLAEPESPAIKTGSITSVGWTDMVSDGLALQANQQIEALCKSVDALCTLVSKLLESQTTQTATDSSPVSVPQKLEENTSLRPKNDRFKAYAKVLNGLAKRVEKTGTTLGNVTGELPTEEE